MNTKNTALVIIDPQRLYCDPLPMHSRANDETDTTCRRIASIMPAFRAAGLPIYVVKMRMPDGADPKDAHLLDIHALTLSNDDMLVEKSSLSAFTSSPLTGMLLERGITNTIVAGFNRTVCITESVLDGRRKNFGVTLLSDLVADDNDSNYRPDITFARMLEMNLRGVEIEESAEVLARYQKKRGLNR